MTGRDNYTLPIPNLKLYIPSARPSLKPVLKSAELIQENVPDFEQFKQNGMFWIQKEFISANTLQIERFRGDKVYIQRSQAIRTLFSDESQKTLAEDDVIYLSGPIGMGKSYAIMLYILFLRKKYCPVLYINNPIALLENPVPYLSNEIIYAISGELKSNKEDLSSKVFDRKGEEIPDEAILNYLSKIEDYRDVEGVLSVIRRLHAFYSQKKQQFMLIFDQYAKSQEKCQNHPVSMELIEKIFSCFTKKIYGRSVLQYRGTSMLNSEIVLGSNFDIQETIIYLINRLNEESALAKSLLPQLKELLTQSNHNPEDDAYKDFSKIKEVTACIPYELEVLVRIASDNLDSTLETILPKYYSTRMQDIKQIHSRWTKKLSDSEKDRLIEFIFLLDNSLAQGQESLENLISQPDPNLIYYDTKTSQWYYISDLVKNAVYQYYRGLNSYQKFVSGSLTKYIKDILKIMQSKSTPARSKGNLFERFIEYSMRIAIHRQEYYEFKYYTLPRQENLVQLPFGNTRTTQFTTAKDLEIQISGILTTKNVGVLLPTDPNFSYVDFIIIDAQQEMRRVIYLLQSTINVNSHSKSDVFYQQEITNLILMKSGKKELISQVMFDITTKHKYVEAKFIWISGDDLWSNFNIDPQALLQNKHKESGIAFTKDIKHMLLFLK